MIKLLSSIFCLSRKENGDDLNNYTLGELNQVVKDFIKSQNTEPSQKDQKSSNQGD